MADDYFPARPEIASSQLQQLGRLLAALDGAALPEQAAAVASALNTRSDETIERLAEDFLKEMEISQYRLAKGIAVPPRRINEIVQGKRSITADTALRFARGLVPRPKS